MSLLATFLLPHAPVLIEDVGGEDTKRVIKTVEAMKDCAKKIESLNPDVIIVISPHGPIFSDAIVLYDLDSYEGDFKEFGSSEKSYSYDIHYDLLHQIEYMNSIRGKRFYALRSDEFERFQYKPTLDHGVLVPLHFLKSIPPILAMSYGTFGYHTLMKHGLLINEAIEALDLKAVIIASGDLSHALSDYGPYSKHENGLYFDHKIIDGIRNQKPYDIFLEPTEKIADAKECGLRSLALALGAYTNKRIKCDLYSYEAPYGVGYLCAGFFSTEGIAQYDAYIDELECKKNLLDLEAHSYIKLAKAVLKLRVGNHWPVTYFKRDNVLCFGEETINFNKIEDLDRLFKTKSGVFVSIHDPSGLRGCMGHITSQCETLLEEIINCTQMAAFEDPRFGPIEEDELNDLVVSVDILSALELVESVDDLNPKVYGILVCSGEKRGLLLPDLEGVHKAKDQVKIASNKGGFPVDKIEKIYRFTVERFK